MKYLQTYNLLKKAGHEPWKAAEIILDASRGDLYAIQWIKILFKQRERIS